MVKKPGRDKEIVITKIAREQYLLLSPKYLKNLLFQERLIRHFFLVVAGTHHHITPRYVQSKTYAWLMLKLEQKT